MKAAFAILMLLATVASALNISAPGLRSWQSYELFMSTWLPPTNWVDLCTITGTNGCIVSPDGQRPTFFRAQFNSPMGVELAWNPSPGADGYHAFCGSTSRVYTQSLDCGTPACILAVTNVAPVLFFAVTAYETVGGNFIESDYSTECVWTNQLTLVIQ